MKFKAHLFICTQQRADGQACGNNPVGAQSIRDQLKSECKRLMPGEVRINTAGCLGHCERGVVAVLYPSGQWYFDLKSDDIPKILQDITKVVSESK